MTVVETARDQFQPPEAPKVNHAAAVVVIHGYNWLADPAWGADDYTRAQFLRPMIFTINDHLSVSWKDHELFVRRFRTKSLSSMLTHHSLIWAR
jgi:hypothetical protein